MPDLAVVLVGHRKNWNSLSALAGALEIAPRFRDLQLVFARPEEAPARVSALAAIHTRVVAGFSFVTPEIVRIAQEVTVLLRALPAEARERVSLVAGGAHATASWRSTLALGFDYAVIGEGEVAFPDLLWRIAAGDPACTVRGVAQQGPAGYVYHGRARPVCLDDYPSFSAKYHRQGPVEISRGCPHHCRFCATPFLSGRHPRHRRLADVLRYVESCLAAGVDQIRFIAPDSFAYGSADGTPRLDLLAELLRGTSSLAGRQNTFLGSFPSEVRPESVSPGAVELIARYCGNNNLVIGAQSGSQRMLDRMRRGHSVTDIYRAVDITAAAGLVANVDIIFGLPGETVEDRHLTIKLIEDLARRGARIHSHTFLPLPGSPWAHYPPGQIDDETARWLGGLAGQGVQYGSWQKQAEDARHWSDFLAQIELSPR